MPANEENICLSQRPTKMFSNMFNVKSVCVTNPVWGLTGEWIVLQFLNLRPKWRNLLYM